MKNAISAISAPPPAPNPTPQQPIGNAMQMQPQAGAMPQGQGQGQQQLPPPPSHQQTVEALKHFDAIERELTGLLKDPDLGKADMKSKIIDGATKLVSRGILTPAAAVTQLGGVPEKPFDQKKWLEQNLIQVVTAANNVLAHHAHGFAGQDLGNVSGPSDNDHLSTISGLMGQYKGV